jgi:F-type H+-transporting ATPase subunit beta
MPTGEGIKGRLFNVVGEAIDGIDLAVNKDGGYAIHRKPPKYEDLSTSKERFYLQVLK